MVQVSAFLSGGGEDAATFKGTGGGTSYVIGGGARNGSDKTFQYNGNGTVSISGFYLSGSGKLYRGCGNCTSSYERRVRIDNVLLNDIDMRKGVAKGSEPSYLGEGWNDANCKVNRSDVTYR